MNRVDVVTTRTGEDEVTIEIVENDRLTRSVTVTCEEASAIAYTLEDVASWDWDEMRRLDDTERYADMLRDGDAL
ncbi:hypothetical protein [Actinobaculum sp. 352]|uniref:hypothetical protein n=1 Tax=Actinobaculum sp. 352 TaxID=2490946 RepID=UPI000F7D6661|nr:hypothetical protein [Actinobaculum sp. 352]RTE47917.1 hypothetical protein EKN07_11705 [Actinobaculum sp. 352]